MVKTLPVLLWFVLAIQTGKSVDEQLIERIIKVMIPADYADYSTNYSIVDLDRNAIRDVVLCAWPKPSVGSDAPLRQLYIAVAAIVRDKKFHKVADAHLDEMFITGVPCGNLSDPKFVVDIDHDGVKEIVLDLGGGGAYTDEFGIFKVDMTRKKIIQLLEKESNSPLRLYAGSSAMNSVRFELRNIDDNSDLETIVHEGHLLVEKLDPSNLMGAENPANWEWDVSVYKCRDSMFVYDKHLSELQKRELNSFDSLP